MPDFGSVASSIMTALLLNAAAWAASPPTLATGSPAPDFRLPGIVVSPGSTPASIEVRDFQLSDFAQAKLLCIVFTCNHCPTAQAYEPVLIQLTSDYRDKGVAVVAISPNDDQAVRLDELGYSDLTDSLEDMKIRALDRHFNFPYLYDGADQKVSLAYGPVATPHVFLFDADRKLRYSGRLTDNENPAKAKTQDTRDALDLLLAGKPVTTPANRPFGCSIKWSDKRAAAKEALEKWDQEKAGLKTVSPDEVAALAKNDTDKTRLINLWATWCGPCVTEFPNLVEINRMYRNRPFEMISISMDDPEKRDNVLAFLNKYHASFQYYLYNSDSRDALAKALDPQWPGALPHTIVVAPRGQILYRQTGQLDPLTLKKAIVEKIGRHYF